MSKIAVLGAGGQLGQSLKAQVKSDTSAENWDFYSSTQLDITNKYAVQNLISSKKKYDYIINFAAYTKVDLAEEEQQKALAVNATALHNLVDVCQKISATLIHLSTDYVFDGAAHQPYKETDRTTPINYYGETKLKGEDIVRNSLLSHFILRSGWLYSEFGSNFYLTIKRLAQEQKPIKVVSDQIGTPTHSTIVIDAIFKIINTDSKAFGTYHIGNNGSASWYDFAKHILDRLSYKGELLPIPTSDFPTAANRPAYSVLCKDKFETTFNHKFSNWKDSFGGM